MDDNKVSTGIEKKDDWELLIGKEALDSGATEVQLWWARALYAFHRVEMLTGFSQNGLLKQFVSMVKIETNILHLAVEENSANLIALEEELSSDLTRKVMASPDKARAIVNDFLKVPVGYKPVKRIKKVSRKIREKKPVSDKFASFPHTQAGVLSCLQHLHKIYPSVSGFDSKTIANEMGISSGRGFVAQSLIRLHKGGEVWKMRPKKGQPPIWYARGGSKGKRS